MREMHFNSILIADISEHIARFQPFEKGLNVVTSADNHVGKSSLLKSLYHTLGANVNYDDAWGRNAKLYIAEFTVDGVRYKIARQAKSFAVFQGEQLFLITSSIMKELAPLLEKIFGFGVYLDSKDSGKLSLAPPAFSFMPYYIDQDSGWDVLYESFANLDQYKKRDRAKSLYYHLNVYTKSSVELMAKRDRLNDKLGTLRKDDERLVSIIEALTEEVQGLVPADSISQFDKNLQISNAKIQELVTQIGKKRNQIQQLQASLDQHKYQLRIISEYQSPPKDNDTEKQKTSRCCPRCGFIYDDEIYERVHANFLHVNDTYVRQYIAQVISSVTAELEKEKIKYIEMMARLKNLEVVFDTENDGFDIYVRQRGMKESLNKFNEQLKENRSHQSEIQNELKKLRKELKALPNQKEVEEKYVEFTRLNIIKLDAWNPAYDRNIRLLTPIKAQGTLENKIILAQFVGLFQTMEYFKTRTIRFPFVVDSPRGKEASQESSKNILSMIADISMLPQVILATIDFDEYKDTIGETAKNANIITLQKRNRLLEKDDYTAHEAEIAEILELLKGNL